MCEEVTDHSSSNAQTTCIAYIFAGIACICNEVAIKLSDICCQEGFNPHNCSGSRWGLGSGVGRGTLYPFQMLILINTFVACHNNF